jgi:hypothetical protein
MQVFDDTGLRVGESNLARGPTQAGYREFGLKVVVLLHDQCVIDRT